MKTCGILLRFILGVFAVAAVFLIRSFDATGENSIASDAVSSPLNGGDQELVMQASASATDVRTH